MVKSFAVNEELTVTIILPKVISSKLNTPGPLEKSPLHRAVNAIRYRILRGGARTAVWDWYVIPSILRRWAGEKLELLLLSLEPTWP